jgi:hypothetical protein
VTVKARSEGQTRTGNGRTQTGLIGGEEELSKREEVNAPAIDNNQKEFTLQS